MGTQRGMSKILRRLKRRAENREADAKQERLLWMVGAVVLVVVVVFLWLRPDPATGPVDVNTATLEQLETLPEIGPDLAQRIVAGRPYGEAKDLLRVKGIGEKTLEKFRHRLVFESSE